MPTLVVILMLITSPEKIRPLPEQIAVGGPSVMVVEPPLLTDADVDVSRLL